jgi:hypothetical protein
MGRRTKSLDPAADQSDPRKSITNYNIKFIYGLQPQNVIEDFPAANSKKTLTRSFMEPKLTTSHMEPQELKQQWPGVVFEKKSYQSTFSQQFLGKAINSNHPETAADSTQSGKSSDK